MWTRVQKYFTKRLHGMWDVPYVSRLEALNVVLLEERRLHIDMICEYRILSGLFNQRAADLSTLSDCVTRGHSLKIYVNQDITIHLQKLVQLSCNIHEKLYARESCLCTDYKCFKRFLSDYNFLTKCKGRTYDYVASWGVSHQFYLSYVVSFFLMNKFLFIIVIIIIIIYIC